jgi:predicted glycoside hydrolase/deacetylase ChbG (UPF0249 family)
MGEPVVPGARQRVVIFNADDFGMSEEIDRGILEAHDRGVVTSASLMVDEAHTAAAVEQARQRPALSLGIHVAFDHRGRRFVNDQDLKAVRREVGRQLDTFVRLTGRPPTHIDSHHHVHRVFNVAHVFLEAADRSGVPLRGFSDVFYVGGFYGQPEFGKTDLSRITLGALTSILEALPSGVSEVSCHPGHLEHRTDAFYNREREVELQVLVDPRLKAMCTGRSLQRISFRDYERLTGRRGRGILACPTAPIASGH